MVIQTNWILCSFNFGYKQWIRERQTEGGGRERGERETEGDGGKREERGERGRERGKKGGRGGGRGSEGEREFENSQGKMV